MISVISDSWLTPRRLRAHGLILALCLWAVYLWNMSTPGLLDRAANLKGTDFLHFYTLGSLATAHHGADLYNMQAQSELVAQRVPQAAGIRYLPLYPPQVSIFFAPFARLSYPCALILWLSLSALAYALCCHAVWRTCPNLRDNKLTVLILALAFPAFWHLILRLHRLRDHAQLESNRRRASSSSRAIDRSSALLRPSPAPPMDEAAPRSARPDPPARTQALPNPLPAHLLDHAPTVALRLSCALPNHSTTRLRSSRRMLAQPQPLALALFRTSIRHRSAGPASHRL
jgi:hypothetical protein